MNGPGHDAGAWRNAQTSLTCAHCGASLSAPAGQCPQCGRFQTSDDALTVVGQTPTPAPAPTGSASGAPFGTASEDVTRFVASSNVPGDVTRVATLAPSGDATRFTPPADSSEGETRFASPADASEDETKFATPEDALTVATPVTPPSHKARTKRGSDNGPLDVGQSFGPRYHIIRMLGVGGMGAVYQAWDAELGVAVAIKVIRPEIMEDPVMGEEVSRRFKRELLLARQVTHKNVVRIHDIGDIDGIKYITMSYVEGTDLSTILKRDGKQPVASVLRIARAVISGLVAAHTAGVVHRDLKPANIMIGADGEALIMDFGIAHSMGDPAAPASGTGLVPEKLRRASQTAATTVGSVVGTVEYMAPEQAKGQPIDQRADVYAFGLILYDILLGRRRASSGQSAVDELQRRMASPPPPLQALDKEIPGPLAALVGRCVEPEADKRFQTSAEVVAELDRLDDEGHLIPIVRRLTWRMVAAAVVVVIALLGSTYYVTRRAVQPVEAHEQVSVLIADLDNRTGDATFDHTLEPMIRRALEGAGFITAYDLTRVRSLGIPQPERLDSATARGIAGKYLQGLRVVLSGTLEKDGSRYRIAMHAIEPVSGHVITDVDATIRSRDDVLEETTRLVTQIRKALGDDASETAQQFAMGSLSATSLDVMRSYAASLSSASGTRYEEALKHAQEAIRLDANFGVGYLAAYAALRNLGRLADSRRYLDDALRHLNGMTERERSVTRGNSYAVAGDYKLCVDEFEKVLAQYPGDVGGRNQYALCLTHLRQMKRAREQMEAVVKVLPNQRLFRGNLAMYANYSGDFAGAAREAAKIDGDVYGTLALAFSRLAQGQLDSAREAYEKLQGLGRRGQTFAASGLGDLAAFEGRFTDAVRILTAGAEADLAAEGLESAASKYVAVAYAELSRGNSRASIAAADKALGYSQEVKIRFLAGRIFIEAGDAAKARPLIDSLSKELYPEPRAHAKILNGLVALSAGDAATAMQTLREANETFDTWIGQFELGRASLKAGAASQADSAFDRCLNLRRGEALSLFVDEEPTWAFMAPVYYYLGRSRQELGNHEYEQLYGEYLRVRGGSREDPLLTEVRERASRK